MESHLNDEENDTEGKNGQSLVGIDKEADGAEENRKKNRGDTTNDYKQKDIGEDLVSQTLSEENDKRRILVMKTTLVLWWK